mgnify:CR=1 FL=1
MYALQTGIEQNNKDSMNNLIFHYHNYDRKYYVQGKKDKYYSGVNNQEYSEYCKRFSNYEFYKHFNTFT